MQVYVELVNHQAHGVKLVIVLANFVNSFCLCIKISVHVFKMMLHVKGPMAMQMATLKYISRFLSFNKTKIYLNN